MTIFIKIVQLLLCLSILVFLHELGHFMAAKMFKIKVEKFYLFFNPWFSIFKFKIKDTEYGLGWLPFGGYVKIAGMIDESMDTEQMKKEPQPWEFRTKPAWQRLIVMLGGIIMNIITAIVIYICLLAYFGEQYLPNDSVKYGITVDSVGYQVGFRDGDKILSIDGDKVESFYEIPQRLLLDDAKTVQVTRDGKVVDIPIDDDKRGIIVNARSVFISPRIPFVVGQFGENSPAAEAGIQLSDRIVGINEVNTEYFDQFKHAIKDYKDQDVNIKVIREDSYDTLAFPVHVSSEGMIGVGVSTEGLFEFASKDYNIFQAIPAGVKKTFTQIGGYVKQLKLLFSPKVKAYESIGSFITIGSIFPGTWHWESFWSLTAFISIILAVMNLLPIPGLDGGHVLFTLFEIITRRKPGDKFLEYAQITGMVILLALFALAMWNDISRFIL